METEKNSFWAVELPIKTGSCACLPCIVEAAACVLIGRFSVGFAGLEGASKETEETDRFAMGVIAWLDAFMEFFQESRKTGESLRKGGSCASVLLLEDRAASCSIVCICSVMHLSSRFPKGNKFSAINERESIESTEGIVVSALESWISL